MAFIVCSVAPRRLSTASCWTSSRCAAVRASAAAACRPVDANGASPREIGAVGGNVGLLDGSVNWKPIAQMKQYQGSHLWGTDGCLAQW